MVSYHELVTWDHKNRRQTSAIHDNEIRLWFFLLSKALLHSHNCVNPSRHSLKNIWNGKCISRNWRGIKCSALTYNHNGCNQKMLLWFSFWRTPPQTIHLIEDVNNWARMCLGLLSDNVPKDPDGMSSMGFWNKFIESVCKDEGLLSMFLVFSAICEHPRHPIQSPGDVTNIWS